jgi:hypothetical protein
MEDIWSKVIESLKERVGQQNFDIWIKPIHFISMDGDIIHLISKRHSPFSLKSLVISNFEFEVKK